ncbi:MAG: diacylglycerol/polyprenol kinase family protein [Bacteriovoracia bacterium]
MNTKLHMRTDLHLARKLWHMLMGFLIVTIYTATQMDRSTAVVILGFAFAFFFVTETARLRIPAVNSLAIRVMGPLMRASEINRFSGTPYYVAAALIAIAIFPKTISVLCLIYLAVGDPLASLFGILYGDRSIRFANGKSLIGTLAGVAVCFLASLVLLSSLPVSLGTWFLLSLIGGMAGGMAELLPLEVDDNFSIPMVSGFVLWLAFILLGV